MKILLFLYTFWPLLFKGFCVTLMLWLTAGIVSLIFGFIIGVLRSNRLYLTHISPLLDGITFVFRAVPFYVQLLIAYFVVPHLFGINVSAFSASLCSLGLCSASYVSQIVRGGINAISAGQWEAAKVLGYSQSKTVRYIVGPQMFKMVLPALVGECDQLLKSTSIVSTIGVLELTGAGKNIVAQEMNPLTMYTVLAVVYLVMSAMLTIFAAKIEQKMRVE